MGGVVDSAAVVLDHHLRVMILLVSDLRDNTYFATVKVVRGGVMDEIEVTIGRK